MPPNPTILVHIGYHKTATSFLQSRIFSDPRLFCQPWGTPSSEAVEWFVLEHPQRFSAERARKDFLGNVPADSSVLPVISHEALSGQPRGGRYYADRVVDRLYETFPEARIVIGIREQKALLVSLYYQYISVGGTESLDHFLGQASAGRIGFRPRVRLDHFEYDLMLDLYHRHWKPEDILVLPLELLRQDQTLYIRRLLDFAGLVNDDVQHRDKKNVRRSNVTMRIERLFNRLMPPLNPRPERYQDYPLAYRVKNRALRVMERLGPMKSMGKAEHNRIVTHVDQTVGDYFMASNHRLAKMTDLDLSALGYF